MNSKLKLYIPYSIFFVGVTLYSIWGIQNHPEIVWPLALISGTMIMGFFDQTMDLFFNKEEHN